MQRMGERQKGFTIVELLIVIVVIGILAAITIVAFNGVQAKAKTAKALSEATTVMKKVELYKTLSADPLNAYPIPYQAHQHWYVVDESDMATDDPLTKLPSNLRIIRGDDNAKDIAAGYDSTSAQTQTNPAVYALVVCTGGGAQIGAKVAYPDFTSQTIKWLRSGTCPSEPSS